MPRRLLTIGLLLTALAWCGRTAAKPPDLPLTNKGTLAPKEPLAPVQAAKATPPDFYPVPAELAAPVVEPSFFFQIRPAARRLIASCLLFGIHPLMTLTPPENVVNVDDEDEPNRGIYEQLMQSEYLFQLADDWNQLWQTDRPDVQAVRDESKSTVGPCGFNPSQFISGFYSSGQLTSDLGIPINIQVPEQLHVMPHESPSDDCPECTCPYLRQQRCAPPQTAPAADYNSAPDVQENLRLLQERKGKDKETEIEQKLAGPVSLNFHDAPLSEVIDDIRQWQDVNICVDKAALDAQEISLDHPITIQLDGVTLRSALNLILKQAHLAYVVKDDVVQITTERAARGKVQNVCHPIGDLVDGDLHCPGTSASDDKKSPETVLIQLITAAIAPTEWCEKGGPGVIVFEPISGRLIVSQTPDVQERIADLLASMKREGCKNLLHQCHAAMDAGRQREAADLAAKAYALDPEQAAADPLIYKMHLAGDDDEPVDVTPCLPPVDPDTPAALDQLYRESLRSAPADGKLESVDWAEVCKQLMAPPAVDWGALLTDPLVSPASWVEPPAPGSCGMFEFGVGLDGSVQMFGQLRHGGSIWHVFCGPSGVSVWAAPDGGADPAPAVETGPDFDWDY